jgi:hypothetical protein
MSPFSCSVLMMLTGTIGFVCGILYGIWKEYF